MDCVALPQHFSNLEVQFLFRRRGVEGINAAVSHGIAWWLSARENDWQMLQGLSSHVVTCAMTSFTDHEPVTPGSNIINLG